MIICCCCCCWIQNVECWCMKMKMLGLIKFRRCDYDVRVHVMRLLIIGSYSVHVITARGVCSNVHVQCACLYTLHSTLHTVIISTRTFGLKDFDFMNISFLFLLWIESCFAGALAFVATVQFRFDVYVLRMEWKFVRSLQQELCVYHFLFFASFFRLRICRVRVFLVF